METPKDVAVVIQSALSEIGVTSQLEMSAQGRTKSLDVPSSNDVNVGVIIEDPAVQTAKAKYVFSFEGREHESKEVECVSLDAARNEAVRYLGAYLSQHPGFANEGHWRVNVEDDRNHHLLHVIVATVTSRYTRDLEEMDRISQKTE
jgi:hypothetical protein